MRPFSQTKETAILRERRDCVTLQGVMSGSFTGRLGGGGGGGGEVSNKIHMIREVPPAPCSQRTEKMPQGAVYGSPW